jgi:CheY-like chemotaxis protein
MSLKIIICDDDPVVLFLHKRLVTNNGWDSDPLLFPNAAQTLSYLLENMQDGNGYLLLLDINMPVMSGWELLDQINTQALEGIHAVVISSSVNSADHKKAGLYPQVVAYLEKPITAVKLQELVQRDPVKRLLGKALRQIPPST